MRFLGLDYVYPATIEPFSDADEGNPLRPAEKSPPRRWRVSVGLEPRNYETISPDLAAHRAHRGSEHPFDFPMPQLAADIIADAETNVTAAATAELSTLPLIAAADTILPLGRFIAVSGHRKIYQVTQTTTVGTTATDVPIFPPLAAAVSANEVWSANPNLRCRYAADSGGFWSLTQAGIFAPSIVVEEVEF